MNSFPAGAVSIYVSFIETEHNQYHHSAEKQGTYVHTCCITYNTIVTWLNESTEVQNAQRWINHAYTLYWL